jgi:hypothetical protein
MLTTQSGDVMNSYKLPAKKLFLPAHHKFQPLRSDSLQIVKILDKESNRSNLNRKQNVTIHYKNHTTF